MARFPDSALAWPSIVPILQLSTVLHLLVIGNLIAMTMALAYGKSAASRNPVRLFVLSKLLQATGWTLINLRGEIPLVLSAHVGNPLIMMGFALEAGLLIIPWRIRSVLNLVLATEVVSGALLLWLFARSPGELVAVSGSTVASIYATGGVALLASKGASRLQRLTGLLFLLFVPIMLMRVVHSASTGAGLLDPTLIQSLTFVVQFSFLQVGTLAFVLLMKEADDLSLQASEARERARLKLQDQFLDMLTHELRAALGIVKISGSSLRLQLADAPADILQRLDSMRKASDAMSKIIDRCLQLDRLERREQPVLLAACPLTKVFADLARPTPDGDGRLDLSVPADASVRADRQLLDIMLENLIDNALKYSPADSRIGLRVTMRPDEAGHSYTVIRIRNQVRPSALPDPARIFERYYRGPEAHEFTGTGLGLHLVRSLAHLQGGDIRFDIDNEGAMEFELSLPAAGPEGRAA